MKAQSLIPLVTIGKTEEKRQSLKNKNIFVEVSEV